MAKLIRMPFRFFVPTNFFGFPVGPSDAVENGVMSDRFATLAIADIYVNGQSQNRTDDTRIFSPVLYQLSYLPRTFMYVCDDNPARLPCQQVVCGVHAGWATRRKRARCSAEKCRSSSPLVGPRRRLSGLSAGKSRALRRYLQRDGTMRTWPPVTTGSVKIVPETHGRSPSLRLPLARLLQLLMILQAERYPNARRLAEACAVSRRTIYRDLATLEAAGIQVLYSPDRQGYQLARECLLQPLQLEDHEALALLIMSRSSRADEPFGLGRRAQSALAKVVQALPPLLRARITRCGELLPDEAATADIGKPERRAIDEAILSVLMHRKALHLRSHDPDSGDAIATKLALYRLARIAGQWSLVGYSSFHGGVRIFDLQSVEKAEPTDEPYAIPPRFRLERLGVAENKHEPDHSAQGHDVQLRLNPRAVSLIQGVPQGEDRRLRWAPGGELDLFLRVEISDEFVRWILGFGDQIEVIGPQELRDAVREHAERIARLHGPDAGMVQLQHLRS